jgi:hypothetical protein
MLKKVVYFHLLYLNINSSCGIAEYYRLHMRFLDSMSSFLAGALIQTSFPCNVMNV